MEAKDDGLKVFISRRESVCGECKEQLGRDAWIALAGEKGALCLSCADLDHLVFLPSGDAALTRRARKHSTLAAVVLRWSRTRERYERQGLLVEEEGLRTAEVECLADHDVRARQRERGAVRRSQQDQAYVEQFTARVPELYPGCPPATAAVIAGHACEKYSGRVGRSAAAKALDRRAVELATAAHVRHAHTHYDRLLADGVDRREARATVRADVLAVLASWERGEAPTPLSRAVKARE